MEALRETLLIAEHDVRHAVRTRRAILFLLIYALSSLVAGAILVWVVAEIHAQIEQQLSTLAPGVQADQLLGEAAAAYKELLNLLVGDEEKAKYLSGIPMVVLFFFWGTRTFLPWLIVLMGYDQINGEMQNRSARYVLLRARRGSFVIGKMLSLIVLLMALTIITNILVLFFAAIMIDGLDIGLAARHLIRFWVLTLPLGLCWIAMMSLLSSVFRSPYVALLMGLICLVGTAVIGWMARIIESLAMLRWLVPWHYGGYLVSHRAIDQLFGMMAFIAFAAFFTLLSYIALKYRDV